MDNKKEKMHPFFKILIVLFLIFIAFYIALQSGYYPTRVQKRAMLTKNNIDKFNDDVKNNKELTPGSYIEDDIDYSNFVTKAGNSLTYSLGKVLVEGSEGIKKTIKILFW
jgi:hypothetical protein